MICRGSVAADGGPRGRSIRRNILLVVSIQYDNN